MAARYALPSQSFGNVQRYLRQKRAGGQTVTPRETRLAWQAHFDAMAGRRMEQSELNLRRTVAGHNIMMAEKGMELKEEALKREEDAAKISGITQLGSTAMLGAMALKGTEIGSKIGLGPGGAAIAPATKGAQAAVLEKVGAAGITGPTLRTGAIETLTEAAPSTLATGAAGAVGGLAGAQLVRALPGKAGDVGQIGGAVVGGAAAGFAMGGGPIGAVVGGVIGGAVGAVRAVKD